MATEIIDLDELLGADKRVRLKGKVYVLPPDLPAELYLQIVRFAREEATEGEMIEALYEQLLELFRYKDQTLKTLPVTISQVVLAVGKIYGDGTAPGQEERPPPRTRGGRSTSRRRTS